MGPHQECPVGENRGPGAGIPSIIIYLLLTSINSLYHCWYTPMKNRPYTYHLYNLYHLWVKNPLYEHPQGPPQLPPYSWIPRCPGRK